MPPNIVGTALLIEKQAGRGMYMDLKEQAWAQFAATGRVEDYLRFRMQAGRAQPTQEASTHAPEHGRPGHPGTEYR